MKCPNCDATLVMADRQGVEIDYCPQCRGVWLDRGELDKIIERSAEYEQRQAPPPTQHTPPPSYPPTHDPYHDPYGKKQHDPYYDPHYKHKKKKGFLGDFFDFD